MNIPLISSNTLISHILLVAAYMVYLIAITTVAVVLLLKMQSWRTAVTVTLIIAKLWLAVYSLIHIDVPLLALYSRKTWQPIAVITFNEVQFISMLLTNIVINRETIMRLLRGRP